MKFILLYIFTFMLHWASAQNPFPSRLSALDDEELLEIFNEFSGDSIAQEQIARTYLDRARRAKDTVKMARGYDRLARIFHHEKNLAFADSIIALTQHLHHKTYPALGYILKAASYYNRNDYLNALDNFLLAEDASKLNNNLYFQTFIQKNIIHMKMILGNSEESIKLSKRYLMEVESNTFRDAYKNYIRESYELKKGEVEEDYFRHYLEALDLITQAYMYSKKYDSALKYSKRSIIESDAIINNEMYYSLLARSGEVEFYLGNYNNAIDSLVKGINSRKKPHSLLNDYYYLGSAYLKLNNNKLGIYYLDKADSIYNRHKKINPSQSRLFHLLYDYYLNEGNKNKQLEYLNKVTFIDSLFSEDVRYFNEKITYEYDIPKMFKAKNELIEILKSQNKHKSKMLVILIVALAIISVLLIYFWRQRVILRRRFNNLLENESKKKNQISSISDISIEKVNDLLDKLDSFEKNKNFLEVNLSLNKLAKSFETNSNYLSRVVNLKKEKNFSQYLHDLRIEYATERLIKDSFFRKYTIKAVAEECGYSSAESFSKAFYRKHGIYPSYFVKKLNKPKL